MSWIQRQRRRVGDPVFHAAEGTEVTVRKLATALTLILFLIGSISVATASTAAAGGGVCGEGDSGKFEVDDGNKYLVIYAPDGYLIDGYCVKAGSGNQGLGAEYVVLDSPQAKVKIYHSSWKDISHYSYTLVEECDY
jgi:hypothetical protein